MNAIEMICTRLGPAHLCANRMAFVAVPNWRVRRVGEVPCVHLSSVAAARGCCVSIAKPHSGQRPVMFPWRS